MAGTATRRSTRQTTSTTTAVQYNDNDASSSSENEDPKLNAKTTTRRTRKRTRDDKNDIAEQPPKKKSTATTTRTSRNAPPKTTQPQPTPTNTNRDASNHQQTYWLFKAEPTPRYQNGKNISFSLSDLRACTEPEPWTGVRNTQARNNMRAMRVGDLGFFYHSNAKPSAVVGILRVVREAHVDETAFDPLDPYFDARSDRKAPKWWCVDVEFVREFGNPVALGRIKECAGEGGALRGLELVRNSRLSVGRVGRGEWEFILGLAGEEMWEGEG
ncbi:DUF55-domain-containing protein [Decorospora gaudefroyi]|uniref:Thymocyte nuclear protein 1 n=1 Tax=Decorospora gaudefroyi TaxID=184978 RepID=A0A6A5JX63_9PLEO|nr:DUF55-domain-containing protein [Decorospora gaudefroyi]